MVIFSSNTLAILTLLFTLLPFCFTIPLQPEAIDKLRNYERLQLTSVVGPESLAFDPMGGGPYTGVSDGRVLKWLGPTHGWAEFAVPSRHRSDEGCNGSHDAKMEDKCGRPLGLKFHKATGELYIADAYFGLLVVTPNGGVATQLATGAEGEPFGLTNGVDIDQESGMVYFTDSSTVFQRRQYIWSIITRDTTGRLMSYNPSTKKVSVLLRGLQFPNGVAMSKDNTFLLVAETTNCRILKYWLRGPMAGMVDIFAQLPGFPDNIKRNHEGEFWVALNPGKGKLAEILRSSARKISKLSMNYDTLRLAFMEDAVAMRLNEEGKVLEVLDGGNASNSVSEVEEKDGTLWLGSVVMPYVGIYKL